MASEEREALIEKMARAIAKEINANYDAKNCAETSNGVEPWQERAWLEDTARAALSVIDQAGYAPEGKWIAPDKPTEAMKEAARGKLPFDDYRAMRQAAKE